MATIEEILANYLSQGLQQIKEEDFKLISNEFKKIGKQLEEINKGLTALYAFKKWSFFYDMSEEAQLCIFLNNQHQNRSIENAEQTFFKKALEGYELFQHFREILTGEKIYYSIGALGKKSIAEGVFTFQQLKQANFIQLAPHSKGYRLRLNVSQRKIKMQNEQNKNILLHFEKFVEEGTTLYSSTYRFYKNQSIKKASGENPYYEVGNRGRFYEAYRYLYLSLGKDNSIQPSNQQLIEAFNRTLSGGGQAGSFSRGGDIGLQQDKIGNATFLNIQTLSNTLFDMAELIQKSIKINNKDIILQALKKQRIEEKVLMEATEQIQKIIKEIDKT